MNFLTKRPLLSSIIILALLLGVIIIGAQFRAPEEAGEEQTPQPKPVEIFTFGEAPMIRVSGAIDDTGTVTVSAQASGIVTRVNVEAGDAVARGSTLLSISDTYLGGTTATTQRELAERNVVFQKENENRRTDIAETQEEDLTPQTDDDLARITRAQFRLQGSQVDLDVDTADIQARQARINEARFYPASPLTGTVERIFSDFGDTVTPGTPLAVISGEGAITATAILSQSIASLIDVDAPHFLVFDNERIEITPRYLSQTATDSASYSIVFELPESVRDRVTDGAFAPIEITLLNNGRETAFVPLDAVTVSQDASYVFVETDGIAQERRIETDIVAGSFVRVLSGLEPQDRVIVERSISNGDRVVNSK